MHSLLRRGNFRYELGDAFESISVFGQCMRVYTCVRACMCVERDETLTRNPDSRFRSRMAPGKLIYSTHLLAVLHPF